MFEIFLKQIQNCIMELEDAEREMNRQLQRLQQVYAELDSLVDGNMDKRALSLIIDEVAAEKNGIKSMREVLFQVVRCYKDTEKKLVSNQIIIGAKEGFRLNNLNGVKQADRKSTRLNSSH